MAKKKELVIIGAGPAGLTAALEVLRKSDDYNVTILEETGMIGGISATVNHNGNRMDLGGHRFFSKEKRVLEFWDSLMTLQGAPAKDDIILGREKPLAPGGPDPEKTDRVMLLRSRVSRIYYLRKFFDYPISLRPVTIKNLGLKRTLLIGMSYVHSAFIKRKENNLEDFMINRFGKLLYSLFFENYTQKVWGRHPSDISAEWGAQRIRGLNLMKTVLDFIRKSLSPKKRNDAGIKTETSLIESFIYPKFGPGQLWELAADEVVERGGDIRMNSKADSIDIVNGTVVSVGYGGRIVPCDMLFSSMPLKDLVGAIKGIDIPPDVREIANDLPYRDFMTVGLLVNKLKIRNETNLKTVGDIVPDCWIYIQEPDVMLGRLQIFNNWSPYMVVNPEENVWIGLEYFCDEGDALWNMTDDDFIGMAAGELENIGVIDRHDIIDSVRIRIRKAYPAYFGSYDRFGEVRAWLDSISGLYCIGRNGQHRYNNMDHSMMTGMTAADSLMSGRDGRADVWSVNTDKDYHETEKK